MHTIANLTSQDAMILAHLAQRDYSDKAFRICRAMQAHDAVDHLILWECEVRSLIDWSENGRKAERNSTTLLHARG